MGVVGWVTSVHASGHVWIGMSNCANGSTVAWKLILLRRWQQRPMNAVWLQLSRLHVICSSCEWACYNEPNFPPIEFASQLLTGKWEEGGRKWKILVILRNHKFTILVRASSTQMNANVAEIHQTLLTWTRLPTESELFFILVGDFCIGAVVSF